ncbi:T9SS type A sorting domain-containing protein [Hymenobacter sp. M29]|uniref:T9SS type A sorting domain-containing protein n=1 Tax=Hymenobacter mellowenesis TaxID=3063995 RepID=A0ABT9AAS7_9BACT|nr:T9SS type A sorting domain-containing protein [Hymenobacter sp. M29]MDO7846648.1 T9SS type A sorting domain-containing protein [Hymenobacter sp. M29]
MKHAYRCLRPLLAVVLLMTGFGARAQQAWRPFRPGLIYAYREVLSVPNNLAHTLRVDSVYATANGDSVYAFNQRLRTSTATAYPTGGSLKSRNNLFGALMRWRPGQASYTLEALAQANVQTAVSLELFPRAAVGSTWIASSQPLRTATLASRSWETLSPGVQDTVSVININTAGATATVRLSRRYGLLAGPQWLGGATGSQMEQALLPASFAQSLYNPVRLFDVQPGDEFGYDEDDIVRAIRCYDNKILRRIVSRRLTADSLIITYQEQRRNESFGYAGPCSTPAYLYYSPITINHWAIALSGNQWQPGGATMQLGALRLLTGEYVVIGTGSYPTLLVGMPIGTAGGGGCSSIANRISYYPHYVQNPSSPAIPIYRTGLDYAAWQYSFAPASTTTMEGWYGLIYSRRTINGAVTICGSPLSFRSLLPTRAAQAAELATLHPNPAAEAATLTLAQPARAGQALRLTDALGRPVWQTLVTAGQTTLTVPLAGQPAGLYLLHLSGSDGNSATWKLTHE